MPYTQARRPTSCGFTLIELLVVVGILATLIGMLMPMLGMADRLAKASATRSVMAKVDVATRLFRADIGAYPYQRTYADPLTGGATVNWSNKLLWHLGTTMTAAQMAATRADADAAAARYAVIAAAPNNFAFTYFSLGVEKLEVMLNRMGAERGRLMLYSGNLDATGPKTRPYVDVGTGLTITPAVKPTGKLVPNPTGSGWADDYLDGEMERRYTDGEQVLDAWKRPLIYVCQVTEGVYNSPTINLFSNNVQATWYGMNPLGRTTLAERDAITGTMLVAHATRLPDLANLRHSDRRFYAAPTFEAEFELWSAGPDGQADWMRDATINSDNVALTPYDKRLP